MLNLNSLFRNGTYFANQHVVVVDGVAHLASYPMDCPCNDLAECPRRRKAHSRGGKKISAELEKIFPLLRALKTPAGRFKQLAQYVFDGGLRRAQLKSAKAANDEAGARHRGAVLSAFQQIEDDLSLLADLGTALKDQRDASDAAQRAVDLALKRYKQGTVGYPDVVLAQTAADGRVMSWRP